MPSAASHGRSSLTHYDADFLRRAYMAFRSGARLQSYDVKRLIESRGLVVSANRLRELGRDSDRGIAITPRELHALISAWAEEQRMVYDNAP